MQQGEVVRLMLGGDTMLGRIVADHINRLGADYPLAPVATLLAGADLAIVNLECALTSSHARWQGAPKAFYFSAPQAALGTLRDAGIDMVSVANNHTLDFGVAGLIDTLALLDQAGIARAGAGRTLDEALRPAMVERNGLRFGMAAFCDHQEDFAAAVDRPGIAWLDLEDEEAAQRAFAAALSPMQAQSVDWPILSLHWGPNMVWRPSARFRRLAHAAVDMGWRLVFGHSAHVFHGIELYGGCPILYAAGDLVDDYWVDPDFRNDHQFLFELEVDARALRRLTLHPLLISNCRVCPAGGEHADWAMTRMETLCAELGTPTRREKSVLRVG